MPPAAVYKPSSKWSVVAASIFALLLHAVPVVWVEMQQERLMLGAAMRALTHPMEKASFEKAAEADTADRETGQGDPHRGSVIEP